MVLTSGCTSEPKATPQPTQPAPTQTVVATPGVTQTTTAGATTTLTAQAISVEIKDFKFNPAILNIAKGTTVTWTQNDSAPHTVTATSGENFDSAHLNQGQTYSYTFNEAGTVVYGCTIHPYMSGTIIVT